MLRTKRGDSLLVWFYMQNFIFKINQLILTPVMDREITIKKRKNERTDISDFSSRDGK
jgi:hypothetical protein